MPLLGTSEAEQLRRRMAALERKVAALTKTLAAERTALEPLKKLYERFTAEGGALDGGTMGMGGTDPTAMPDVEGLPGGAGYGRKLAAKLGLDDARAKALTEQIDRFMVRVKAQEKQHAKVKVDGDVTTITIPRYPDGGDGLRREWEDWVSGNLTSAEQGKYRADRATNRLFGNRLGSLDRTVRIDEKGGGIKVSEGARTEEGQVFETQMQGPSAARDLVLEGYLHLLP